MARRTGRASDRGGHQTSRLWCRGLCAAAFIAGSTAGRAGAQSPIIVGPNVRVSTARPETFHNELLIAADPENVSRLLACSHVGLGANYTDLPIGAYASFDGGRSWTAVATDSGGYTNDPACSYGPDGSAYFTGVRRPQAIPARPRYVVGYYSTDAGRTWNAARIPRVGQVDRPYVVADNTASPYRGRVYIVAGIASESVDGREVGYGIGLWRSLDRGATFERPIERRLPSDSTVLVPWGATVLSDGGLVAVYERSGPVGDVDRVLRDKTVVGSVEVVRSSDGGETFLPAVRLSEMHGFGRGVGSVAVDASPSSVFRDRLYVVWADGRLGKRMQPVLTYSADGGRTWSRSTVVNDDRRPWLDGQPERPAELPTVAVNQHGVVGVLWHDRRNHASIEDGYDVRFAASYDGGETFTPSVRVSERPRVLGRDERWLVAARTTADSAGTVVRVERDDWPTAGHTQGLTADASGTFHALWADNRTGVLQMWTAGIAVQGRAVRHGSVELADLADVSSAVRLDFLRPRYDRARNELTVRARLTNNSKSTIRAPLVVRALALDSQLGSATVVGADNRATGSGAVWDFSPLLADGELPSGRHSGERTLVFRFADLVSSTQWWKQGAYPGVLDLSAQVLGPRLPEVTER